MNEKTSQMEKADAIAKEILGLSRSTLLVNLRFLDVALSQFKFIQLDNIIGTDGDNLYYDPRQVLRLYKKDKNSVTRLYLHTLVHCICRHMFASVSVNRRLWDLACDMATENVVADLDVSNQEAADKSAKRFELRKISDKSELLTAERIYAKLKNGEVPNEKIEQLIKLFKCDDHELWYESADELEDGEVTFDSEDNSEAKAVNILTKRSDEINDSQSNDETEELAEATEFEYSTSQGSKEGKQGLKNELELFWKDVSERLQTDLETISVNFGDKAGSLVQNLKEVNREKYDYGEFLKKFAVMGERMMIDDDEFDYIYYTYGMKLYDKMPLIEPLEYKEVKRIKEFVIAIDTSGSVRGELVQRFVEKTFNILKQQETFFTRINLHIIQCDAVIQEDAKITNQEEFDRYISTMQLHGMGGTDYRPVFEYVEKLRRNKEFTNLKGLIYFTDGFGTYPAHQPDYQTAFVFVNDDYETPNVPVWAIKLILQSDDI